MQNVPQPFKLKDIAQNKAFNSTNYSLDLHKAIESLEEKHRITLFRKNNIPIADFKYTPDTITHALTHQYYPVKIRKNKTIIITCNPYHEWTKTAREDTTIYLTPPTNFIYHLAAQHDNGHIEGLWNICHFFAHHLGSTDIHLCKSTGASFNQNGHYQFTIPIETETVIQLAYFIKLKSHLDPANATTPQDGAYQFNVHPIALDGRIATLPTQQGELISIRLFNHRQSLTSISSLGFSPQQLKQISNLLHHSNGLILITGSTGAGKTTTLYALLNELKDRHIITLEDPIEKIIPHTHQTTINQLQNYTMDTALKAILRHNPEVIAIGEIRDRKTAEAVINAAYSGHLIIASLHTNSIETTLLRLSNLGISPFLISYCLRGIISQSLELKNNKQCLKSDLLICRTPPYIISNIKKELPAFLNYNDYPPISP